MASAIAKAAEVPNVRGNTAEPTQLGIDEGEVAQWQDLANSRRSQPYCDFIRLSQLVVPWW